MPMNWTSAAQMAMQESTYVARWRAYLDIEYAGGHGLNVIEITSRVLAWGQIERSTSAIDKSWSINPVSIKLRNSDSYFTPNLFAGARDIISNVWRMRPVGEADARDCRLYIDLEIMLPSGTTETKRMFRGQISSLNFMDGGSGPVCELSAKDMLIDALDRTFTLDDGETDTL